MEKNEFKQTAGNAGIIGLTAVGGAAVGFVLQLLIAYYFGAAADTDAFFMAQSTSELLSKLLLGGSIVSVFIPMFVQKVAQSGKAEAWNLALTIIHVAGLAYVALLILVGLFATPFVHFIAPGFSPATSALTVNLLRIMIPAFFLLFMVDLATAILHAVKHFTVPAMLRIIAPTISALAVIILAPTIGVFALAIGVLFGAAVQLALVASTLKKQGFSYRPRWRLNDPAVKRLLLLVYPFIFSMLATQAAGIVYRILVSDLPVGSLSALKYAEKVTQLLTTVFLTSVAAAVYPLLSEKASRGGASALLPALSSAVRLVFFVSLPITIGTIFIRTPLIQLIFERGSFTTHSTATTSIALFYLAIGLITNGIGALFGYTTLALQKTKAAVAVTILSQCAAIALFAYLTPRMGHAGLALASSLVPIAIAVMYMAYLRRFIPNILSVFWHPTYIKSIILAVAMTAGLYAINSGISPTSLPTVIHTALLIAVGMGIYIYGAHLMGVSEVATASELVVDKLKAVRQKFL